MVDHASHMAAHTSDEGLGWLVLLVPIVCWVVYLIPALQQQQEGRPWSRWRIVSFTAGMGLIATALAPPIMHLAHGDLRWHMVQHLVLGMMAPLGLVLAAPITLLLRTVPVDLGRAIARALRCRPVHILFHPVTALLLNIGGMYVLYLTPLFAWSLERPVLHWLIMIHLLIAGYLFTWGIAGPDAAPRRPTITTRTVVLALSVGLHAFLGKLMYAHVLPRDVPFDADQIREGAILMYYGGDIAEALLAIVLFNSWYQSRQRRRQRRTTAPASVPLST